MSRSPFRGAVPDGLLYDTTHDMWVRREGEDVVLGATTFGIFLAGEIIAFTATPKGAEVALGRGRPLAWEAECGGLVDAAGYRAHVRRIEPEAEIL